MTPLELHNAIQPYALTRDIMMTSEIFSDSNNINKSKSDRSKSDRSKSHRSKSHRSKSDKSRSDRPKSDRTTLYKNNSSEPNKYSKVSALWYPPHRDKLFWGFYYVYKGELAYTSSRDHEYTVERETKINAVELLRNKQSELTKLGIKHNEVSEELVHAKRIGRRGLCGLCIAYNVNIIYQHDQTYMEIPNTEKCDGYIITCEGRTGLKRNECGGVIPSIEDIKYAREHLYYIASAAKPIRAISAYTLKELTDIARKLEISTVDSNGKSLLKKTLYNNISGRVIKN